MSMNYYRKMLWIKIKLFLNLRRAELAAGLLWLSRKVCAQVDKSNRELYYEKRRKREIEEENDYPPEYYE